MVCIAGGAGRAPLLSGLEAARKGRGQRPCAFLFGARGLVTQFITDALPGST